MNLSHFALKHFEVFVVAFIINYYVKLFYLT